VAAGRAGDGQRPPAGTVLCARVTRRLVFSCSSRWPGSPSHRTADCRNRDIHAGTSRYAFGLNAASGGSSTHQARSTSHPLQRAAEGRSSLPQIRWESQRNTAASRISTRSGSRRSTKSRCHCASGCLCAAGIDAGPARSDQLIERDRRRRFLSDPRVASDTCDRDNTLATVH